MIDFKLHTKPKPEPHISFNDEEVDINSIPDQSITLNQYKTVRANSEGFRILYTKLDNKALKYAVKHCLDNCDYYDLSTYNGSLQVYLVPELLKRLSI